MWERASLVCSVYHAVDSTRHCFSQSVSPICTASQTVSRFNNTIIGYTLYEVPVFVDVEGNKVSLCYEVQGEANQHFNLISDTCKSVLKYRSGGWEVQCDCWWQNQSCRRPLCYNSEHFKCHKEVLCLEVSSYLGQETTDLSVCRWCTGQRAKWGYLPVWLCHSRNLRWVHSEWPLCHGLQVRGSKCSWSGGVQ